MKTTKMLFVLVLSLIFSCAENENRDEKNLEVQTVIEEKSSLDEEMIFEEKIEVIVEQKEENIPTNSDAIELLEKVYEEQGNQHDEIITEEEIETIFEKNKYKKP